MCYGVCPSTDKVLVVVKFQLCSQMKERYLSLILKHFFVLIQTQTKIIFSWRSFFFFLPTWITKQKFVDVLRDWRCGNRVCYSDTTPACLCSAFAGELLPVVGLVMYYAGMFRRHTHTPSSRQGSAFWRQCGEGTPGGTCMWLHPVACYKAEASQIQQVL